MCCGLRTEVVKAGRIGPLGDGCFVILNGSAVKLGNFRFLRAVVVWAGIALSLMGKAG
jgi:hypothetical protein